jgi:hypothetical protein
VIWLWALAALAGAAGVAVLASPAKAATNGGRMRASALRMTFAEDERAQDLMAQVHDTAETIAELVIGQLGGDFPREGVLSRWEDILWEQLVAVKTHAEESGTTGIAEALRAEERWWADLAAKVLQVSMPRGGMANIVVDQLRVLAGAMGKTAGAVVS